MERDKKNLFLHKDEWNRLKYVGAPLEEPRKINDYLPSLIEKSQQWINSWPDSVQGHILKLEKQRAKQLEKDIAMIKLFKKEQEEINKKNVCIEKAKQIIFDDSCYGRQLISALVESKTLEERDAQLEFKKELTDNSTAKNLHQDEDECLLQNVISTKYQKNNQATCKRDKDKEVARVNKNIYLTQKEDVRREKEMQRQMEIEDMQELAKLNDEESFQKKNKKNQFKKDLEQFRAEQKEILNNKALRDTKEQKIVEIWKKYEDRKDTIIKKMHEKRFQKAQTYGIYDLIKTLNDDEKNRYDEFINKGITTFNRRLQMKEEEDNQKRIDKHRAQTLLMQSNKKLEDAKRLTESNEKQISCDRQCIITQCKNKPGDTNIPREQDLTFTLSKNRLLENLRIREKEPAPWSGLSAAHSQFARNADRTLQECRYKRGARKVIDDYRSIHGLKPEDLAIPNYF